MSSMVPRLAGAALWLLSISACGVSGVGGTCDFKAGDCMAGLACYAANTDSRTPAYCGIVCSTNADCGGLDCACTALSPAHFFDGAPVQRVCVVGPSNLPCR